MDANTYDAFLNEATHAIATQWEAAGDKRLTTEELYALNDRLTEFFGERKS